MKAACPLWFCVSDILPEYIAEVKNKFEMLMAVQDNMMPNEFTSQAGDILTYQFKHDT